MDVDYKGFSKALGERIRGHRKERGWKHSDIIAKTGISDSQWRKYERGDGIGAESMLKIAACFKMSVSELLRGLGECPDEPLSTRSEMSDSSKAKTKS
jgi:transcriptional regulator with XRE-family HTH domain